MLSKKLNLALNKQMNKEFYSAYAYLAVASYFEEEEFAGFANFFKIQAQEELQHAMKILGYLHDVGGTVTLDAIASPRKEFKTPIEAFKYGLSNEQQLADEIGALLSLATGERHAPTQIFMQWFVTEQVEEEALFTRCIKRLERVNNEANGLLLLDNEFATRTLEPDATEKE